MSDNQQSTSDPVTFINVFEIPSDEVDEFVTRWRERARLMSTAPGFRDAQLHRVISSETRFQLINVAQWESYDHWHDAISDPRPQEEIQRIAPPSQDATPTPASTRSPPASTERGTAADRCCRKEATASSLPVEQHG